MVYKIVASSLFIAMCAFLCSYSNSGVKLHTYTEPQATCRPETLSADAHDDWYTITTVVGNVSSPFQEIGLDDDGGPAANAVFSYIGGVSLDPVDPNVMLIADQTRGLVRLVNRTEDVISTLGGIPHDMFTLPSNAPASFYGDGGPALKSHFHGPRTPIMNPRTKDVFVPECHFQGNAVRRIDGMSGIVETVAGGKTGCSGDGVSATSASINTVHHIEFDPTTYDVIYIVDMFNHAIRKVDLSSGVIITVAGTLCANGSSGDGGLATAAKLYMPATVAFDPVSHDMYIADFMNHAIRRVDGTTGIISTYAGQLGVNENFGDGGQAVEAGIPMPAYVMVHPITRDVYVTVYHNVNVIRRISHNTKIITRVAGIPCQFGTDGDGGSAVQALLARPVSTTYDPLSGGILVGDGGNGAVRLLVSK